MSDKKNSRFYFTLNNSNIESSINVSPKGVYSYLYYLIISYFKIYRSLSFKSFMKSPVLPT